jgi:hypothetical protein
MGTDGEGEGDLWGRRVDEAMMIGVIRASRWAYNVDVSWMIIKTNDND